MSALHSIIEDVAGLIGVEHRLDEVNYALKAAVRHQRPATVGAHHVTCSDVTERACVESFQRCFAADLVPRLKPGNQSAFRTANLAARYEWGSLRIAEGQFATPASREAFKVLLVKINSHVAAPCVDGRGEQKFGPLQRYGVDSVACGALHALLAGAQGPFADELRQQFHAEGIDRLELLANNVPAEVRALAAALVSARLQGRAAALDAQDHRPVSPTLYVIVPAVTLNRTDRDTELVCGLYVIDRRTGAHEDVYRGLADDPTRYQITQQQHGLRVHDDQHHATRTARDHRQLIGEALHRAGSRPLTRDRRVDKLLEQATAHAHDDRNAQIARTAAKGLLLLLAETSPVTAALLLFAQGASGIYHAHRAHRLAQDLSRTDDARHMLADLQQRIDQLPAEQARQVLEVLRAGYKGK